MTATPKQTLAFFNTLTTGPTRVHLEAVLGYGCVASATDMADRVPIGSPADMNTWLESARTRSALLLDLLQSYVDALRPQGYPTRQTLIDLLKRHSAQAATSRAELTKATQGYVGPSELDTETEEVLAKLEGRGRP